MIWHEIKFFRCVYTQFLGENLFKKNFLKIYWSFITKIFFSYSLCRCFDCYYFCYYYKYLLLLHNITKILFIWRTSIQVRLACEKEREKQFMNWRRPHTCVHKHPIFACSTTTKPKPKSSRVFVIPKKKKWTQMK